jgi:general secretion pathway protein A
VYLGFYGLSESPFELSCDPRFVYHTARHRDAFSHLQYGLASGRPLTVLLGEPGMGKTTLLHAALQSNRCRDIQSIYIANSSGAQERLVDVVLAHLGAEQPSSAAPPLDTLQDVLADRRLRGLATALVIDEADSLSDERFNEVCALVASQPEGTPVLPLILAGQLALGARIDRSPLRQLPPHASMRCELVPLELPQTASYILWRARAAGGAAGALFTREAVMLIHELSNGVPRMISVICDNALLSAFQQQIKPVTRDIVADVCRRLDVPVDSLNTAALSIGPGLDPTPAIA